MTNNETMNTNNNRGGRRPGAGRKPAGTKYANVRLTPAQHTKLSELGGSAYLQKHLDNEIEHKTITLNLTAFQARLLDDLGTEWIERERAELEEHNRAHHTLYEIDSKGFLSIVTVRQFEQQHCDGLTYEEWRDKDGMIDDIYDYLEKDDAIDFAKTKIDDLSEDDLDEVSMIENLNDAIAEIKAFKEFRAVSEVEWFSERLAALEAQQSRRLIVFTCDVEGKITDVRVESAHITCERLNATPTAVNDALNSLRRYDSFKSLNEDDVNTYFPFEEKEAAFAFMVEFMSSFEKPSDFLKYREIVLDAV